MNLQKIQFSLDTRASLALLTGILGIVWQAGIVTFGGEPSRDIIGACVTIILASFGLGFGGGFKSGSSTENGETPDGD